MRSIVLFASVTLFAAAAWATTERELIPYRDADAIAQGEVLYADHCAACHGADLEGEPNWRERDENGLLPAPPHDETGHTWHHPDAQLFDLTKYGVSEVLARRGLDYDSSMMGFGDVLSDAEILAVLAFIKASWPRQVIEMHNEINASR